MNDVIYKNLQKRAIDEDTNVSVILEKLAREYLEKKTSFLVLHLQS